MEKLRMTSPDLTEANIDKLAELFPTVVTETLDADGNPQRAVDFDLLRQELSDHVVDGPQERYRLDWPGKRAAAFAANAPIAKTLRPVREESVDFDTTKNLFIEGDNLEALKLLQESYLGKVKLIYIDPPYNTGSDFVYDDDFAESRSDYLARSGQSASTGERLVVNSESNGRFHSDWLSMMYPRLKLARNLLSDDGIIFISIDDHEAPQLRKLCDEVFGGSNFAGQLVWKKGGTGKNDSQYAVVEHEYVIAYARNAALSSFNADPEAVVSTSYNRQDERGRYSLVRLDSKTLGYVSSLDFDIIGPDGRSYRPEQPAGRSQVARWRWGKDKVSDEYNALVFEKGFVYTKNYEKVGARPRSLMTSERFGVTRTGRKEAESAIGEKGIFDFPKPVKLIQHLIRIASDTDSIVMDFFAGSGTTAQAVMQQNVADRGSRRFILVQLAESVPPDSGASRAGYISIAEIARKRIRGVCGKARGELEISADGFRAFTISSTNLLGNFHLPDETGQASLDGLVGSVKPHRSPEDLLFEVLLDWGVELSVSIVRESFDGCGVFIVDDGAILACFDQNLPDNVLHEMAHRQPLRVVLRDDAFISDSARINAEQIFREVSPTTEVKAI
ncbi:site-specific DNA-methyltransferase [Brevibacterium senegalense]|uniref:site-specific DNA-methyltransferase n=1 Tax=Brevibacterium senegalense TaxID=1033736 RepID=UPI0003146382|nr:site-specific DNA-methyltransferase [Brevibacterium senegalense]